MEQKIDIAIIGECLIELSANGTLADTSTLNKYFGGDTVTTAVAVARLGGKVTYLTKVGNDGFSEFILSSLQKENIDTSLVKMNDEQNGMYIISHTQEKKEILYYKRKTAATKLTIEDITEDTIKKLKLVYSTGVVQSLSSGARELVKTCFEKAKENDVLTAYDPNYTRLIWTEEEAREAFDEIEEYIDIIFLNIKHDSKPIAEYSSVDNIIKRLWDKGISTVVVKSTKEKGYYTGYQGKIEFIKFINEDVIDDTGAGDAFNGGVLHGITSGMSPFKAVTLGSVVAGLQIKKFGAIKSIPDKDEVYRIFKGQND